MKKEFIRFLRKYEEISRSPFSDNYELTSLLNTISSDIRARLIDEFNNYIIDSSYGKGQWAIVPWVAIMNPKITTSVSEGVYIVYLLSIDRKSLFLTINQGTGGIDKANVTDEVLQNREKYIKSLHKYSSIFKLGELPNSILDSKKRTRPKAYEKACIIWKEYSFEQLEKITDIEFYSDLEKILRIYQIEFADKNLPTGKLHETFYNNAIKNNLKISKSLVTRYVTSLLTKPFVILTGLSGSGKTKLAQAFAMWICESEEQYCLVPVGADWTNREPLLGFPNALKSEDYIKPDNGVLDLLIRATKDPDKPYFLILDEMNLSHVERYFSDFLSVMESKGKIALHNGGNEWNGVPTAINFPNNLFIVGTVNIDETTYMFSPKVLDRASVIEFRVNAKDMRDYLESNAPLNLDELEGAGSSMAKSFVRIAQDNTLKYENIEELNQTLANFFVELKKTGAEFGYRTASEIVRFAAVVNKIEPEWDSSQIIDAAIMQKLLPKVHGSRRKLEPILRTLGNLCLQDGQKFDDFLNVENDYLEGSKVKYPISFEKILRMYENLLSNGFTSYAEA